MDENENYILFSMSSKSKVIAPNVLCLLGTYEGSY